MKDKVASDERESRWGNVPPDGNTWRFRLVFQLSRDWVQKMAKRMAFVSLRCRSCTERTVLYVLPSTLCDNIEGFTTAQPIGRNELGPDVIEISVLKLNLFCSRLCCPPPQYSVGGGGGPMGTLIIDNVSVLCNELHYRTAQNCVSVINLQLLCIMAI